MAALTKTTITVKDGNGSLITTAGVCTDGTDTFPSSGILGADGATYMPAMATAATAGFVKSTDGTNTAAVKAASTAAGASDPALVVSVSPNSPAATNADGSVTGATAATKCLLTGGIYNSSAPTLTTGQQAAVQLDSAGNLKVNIITGGGGGGSNAAASLTGSAVPANGSYNAVNIGGTLRGQTGVNPTGTTYAGATDVTSVGGTSFALGQAVAASCLPVVLPTAQITSLTAPVLAAGSALVGKVGIDQTTPGTTNAVSAPDAASASGTITAVDAATTSATGVLNQTVITGSPTANSSVSLTISGQSSVALQFTTTNFNGTVAFEKSTDGGTTYRTMSMVAPGATNPTYSTVVFTGSATTAFGRVDVAAATTIRVRCTAFTSGTLTVKMQPGYGVLEVSQLGSTGIAGTASSVVTTVQGIASGTPISVNPAAATTGGATPVHYISAASTNATNVKGSAGTVYSIEVFNNNSSNRYLKLFNKASAPTPGTDTPVQTIMVPGSSNSISAGVVRSYPIGKAFSTGIGFSITGALADNDTTVITANDLVVNIDYI